jgi:hypothetical protein
MFTGLNNQCITKATELFLMSRNVKAHFNTLVSVKLLYIVF